MKRLLVVVVALVVIGTTFTRVYADNTANATAGVFVTVNPNIAVSPTEPSFDMSTIQRGPFSATVTWRVDANVQIIQMMLEASDLFKGGDPTNEEVAPIPLDTNQPALITAEHGTETNGGDNRALWTTEFEISIGNFPAAQTETVTFESSQNNHFSQIVTTQIFYDQDDPEKPTGQYSGKVRLTTLIPPSEGS